VNVKVNLDGILIRVIAAAKANNPKISASIESTDFFTLTPPEDQLFDLIYDNTSVP